jgi:serine palmitoyltransferase
VRWLACLAPPPRRTSRKPRPINQLNLSYPLSLRVLTVYQEIDELVDDWQPTPLIADLSHLERETLESVPVVYGQNGTHSKLSPTGKPVVNMAIYDWLGFVEDDRLKDTAINTLREYGVGSCGPMGFYGTIDMHTKFEQDVSDFLDTESAIIYAQAFSSVSSVIPAFAKRGDIIIADRGINFAIHKGLELSRSTVRWYAHNDMQDLERVLGTVDREIRRKGSKLTKRFIVTEGVFENDGMMTDLPKIQELKRKYKYRLILDESMSFGMVGQHGRGVTEHYGIPASEVEILVGSMANSLGAAGGFCAGSANVTAHQRINSAASVFSAALSAMHATVSSAAVKIMEAEPQLIIKLRDNIEAFRSQLDKLEATFSPSPSPDGSTPANKDALISIPSHRESALIHVFLTNPPSTLPEEEALLQEVVDEALANGLLVTRARRLRGQEAEDPEPSLKVCVSAGFSRKEMEKAGKTLRDAIVKVCGSE